MPLIKLVKRGVEKNSIHTENMDARFVKLADSVEERRMNVENGILTRRIDSTRTESPPTDVSDDRTANASAYSNYTFSQELDSHYCGRCHEERRRRQHRSRRQYSHQTPPAVIEMFSEFYQNILLPVNEG